MFLTRASAIRYMLSMREGGSLPALLETDDARRYVVKLRGAGQGARVLAAEFLAGEIARQLGLRVPRLAAIELDAMFGKTEPDPEVRELFQRSTGLNLGLEYLPQASTYDPVAGDTVSAEEASLVVWLDAFLRNVDRTPRNANLLMVQSQLWLIDHGASLIFHFDWPSAPQRALDPFSSIANHVLLPLASDSASASASAWAHERLTYSFWEELMETLPKEFLPEVDGVSAGDQVTGYRAYFAERLAHSAIFEGRFVVSERKAYNYAVIRIVPRVERDEFLNAAVILFSPQNKFLGVKTSVHDDRLRALWPDSPIDAIRGHIEAVQKICDGDPAAGPIAKLSRSERFQWLTAPRSTMIQVSPVRTGVTDDPDKTLAQLADELIS